MSDQDQTQDVQNQVPEAAAEQAVTPEQTTGQEQAATPEQAAAAPEQPVQTPAAPVADPDYEEFDLPSGVHVKWRKKALGKDLMNAQRVIDDVNDLPYALVAQLALIDGKPVVFEMLKEMDRVDVLTLTAHANKIFSFLSPRKNSSTLPLQ